ncbi:MAG TPA: hypothetical protein VHY58_09585 [Streptosporangiaceae bacterium]|nr:hypothetical protein [Streptosporangiaceae bacterium]
MAIEKPSQAPAEPLADARQPVVQGPEYLNEIGAPARADDLGALTSAATAYGLELANWYGVRIAVDPEELDPEPPSDPGELAALLDVEERLGATDPYRQLGQLARLILRKTRTAAAGH